MRPDDEAARVAFAQRYGPWALVAGASEGVGAAYARAMAERGLGVVLLARRQDALDEVAASIRGDTGADTRAVAVDLSQHDAMARISAATAGLEIGMVMYCAGADPDYEPFLARPVAAPLALVHRNCITSMLVCHHFAGPMAARGRGGIVLVSSAGGLYGGPNVVAYAATKAFEIVLAEALWTELSNLGVDVLALVLGVTDTPALRRLLARRGILNGPEDPAPIPGAVTADEVVAEAVANLANGPTWFVGEQLREGARRLGSMTRSEAVKTMRQMAAGGVMTRKHPEEAAYEERS
jgi:short-subunit dehydrogenase